jgi:uncharacterized membrane protein YdjX (TVP38/TMEM64 family)
LVEHVIGNDEVSGSIPDAGSMKNFFGGYKDYIENIIGLVLVFVIMVVSFSYFDMSAIESFVQRAGIWAPLVLILAKASTMVFAPVSGSPLYPLSGAVFGFIPGTIYLILGDLLGSTISFFISRKFGKKVVERFARGNVPLIDRILQFMETDKGFLIARVCFIALPEAVSYASGLTRITFTRFITISTLVGILPTAILAGAGAWISIGTDAISAIVLITLGLVISVGGGIVFIKMTREKDIPKNTGGL